MKRSMIIVSGIIAGVLILGWAGLALEPQGGQEGFQAPAPFAMPGRWAGLLENDRFRSYLNLTDEQAERLRQILVDTRKVGVKTRADETVRGIELRELLRADKPDRDAVMKKVQEISNLRAEMMKQHIEAILAAKAVLTPEQQKKMRFFMHNSEEARPWREGWRERTPGAPRPPAPQGPPAVRPPHPDEPPVE